jgi:hypothetical protein
MLTVPTSEPLEQIAENHRLAYVVVHADEYAIRVSSQVPEPLLFQAQLLDRLEGLLANNVNVFLLNLSKNEFHPPPFLRSLVEQVVVIPSLDVDGVNDQARRLRQQLVNYRKVRDVVFTGGWKNACLKHTLNQTIIPQGASRVRLVDEIHRPFEAIVQFEQRLLPVMVSIDHAFVF